MDWNSCNMKLIISILLRLSTDSLVSGQWSKCNGGNDPRFEKWLQFHDYCYFSIKGAMDTANKKLPDGKFMLQIAIARQLCFQQEATLPSIHSEQEAAVLMENFGEKRKPLVLGLHDTRKKILWDDGGKPKYWSNDNNDEHAVLLPNMTWKSVHSVTYITSAPVAVVCQQPLQPPGGVARKTNAPVPSRISKRSSLRDKIREEQVANFFAVKCQVNNPVLYPKAVVFNGVCYFTFNDSIKSCNMQPNGSQEYAHDSDIGRYCCKHINGAELIAPKRLEDAEFILNNFEHSGQDLYGKLTPTMGISLNVDINEFDDLVWGDGSKIDYAPKRWHNETKIKEGLRKNDGLVVYMRKDEDGSMTWATSNAPRHKRPFVIVCQQKMPPPEVKEDTSGAAATGLGSAMFIVASSLLASGHSL